MADPQGMDGNADEVVGGVDGMVGAASAAVDPDAPWRPGFTGLEPGPAPAVDRVAGTLPRPTPASRPLTRPDGAAPTDAPAAASEPELQLVAPEADPGAADGSPRRSTLLVAAAAIVVVVAAVAAIAVSRGDDSDLAPIPDQVAFLWSREVDKGARPVVIDDLVIISDDAAVRAFDAQTGEPRWEVPDPTGLGHPKLLVEEGTVLAVANPIDARARGDVVGLHAATGAERWRRALDVGHTVSRMADQVIEYESKGEALEGVFIDPAAGESIGDPFVTAAGMFSRPPVIAVSTPGGVRFLDVETAVITGPTVDVEGFAALTFVRDRLIGIRGGRLQVVDEGGEVLADIDVTLGPEQAAPGVIYASHDSDRVLLTASDMTLAIDVSDGHLDIAWSLAGRLMAFEDSGDVPIAVLGIGIGDRDSSRRVVDVDAGEIIHEFDVVGPIQWTNNSIDLRRDGLLFLDGTELRAFDRHGEELWGLPLNSWSYGVGDVVATNRDGELAVFGAP